MHCTVHNGIPWKTCCQGGYTREKGVDKEDLANEIRRLIGCIWPLRGSVASFYELLPTTKLSANGVVLIM